MILPEICVIRHGETEWNRAGRMQGGLDSPLTDLGRAQAQAMGAALRAFGVRAGVWSAPTSPQGRAVQTARLALAPLGMEAEPVADLREIAIGDWAGLSREEIAAGWPGPEDEHFLDTYARAPGGEGFAALWHRVGLVLAGLTGPVVIVTHGMTSRFLRTRALGLGIDQLDVVQGGQGEVFHIKAGMQRVLPRLHDAEAQGKAGV